MATASLELQLTTAGGADLNDFVRIEQINDSARRITYEDSGG